MSNETILRRLQLCELEILGEFIRICEKHKLRYYLAGGTLLGAVRHGGFIPWDDDIDVEMPRKDYDLFAKYCSEELNERYFYQSADTDKNYFLTYAKLRKNNTCFYEERFANSKFHKGIFIDIFPLDYAPRPSAVGRLIFNLMAVGNRCGQVDSGEKYVPYNKISGKICYTLFGLFTPKGRTKVRRVLVCFSNWFSDRRYWASYSGAYGYSKELFRREWYSRPLMIKFENRKYRIPKEYMKILKTLYGDDYMTLPPESEHRTHCDLNRVRFDK